MSIVVPSRELAHSTAFFAALPLKKPSSAAAFHRKFKKIATSFNNLRRLYNQLLIGEFWSLSEMVLAAWTTDAARPSSLFSGNLVTGPETETPATTLPSESKIGAAIQRIPKNRSSSSKAHPRCLDLRSSDFSSCRSVMELGVWRTSVCGAKRVSTAALSINAIIAFPTPDV